MGAVFDADGNRLFSFREYIVFLQLMSISIEVEPSGLSKAGGGGRGCDNPCSVGPACCEGHFLPSVFIRSPGWIPRRSLPTRECKQSLTARLLCPCSGPARTLKLP